MFIYNEGKEKYYLSSESEYSKQNFEVYVEESIYKIKNSDIVDLYMHDNCIELFYYSNNTNPKDSMGIDALCGISLRITTEYEDALMILEDLGYELYAKDDMEIITDCLYSSINDKDYLKRIFLGECIREIWTKKENIKPFRFDDCVLEEWLYSKET